MHKVPIWKIYSWWVFFMTFLWMIGWLPFSPLLSALFTFGMPILFMRSFNQANVFVIGLHLLPVWILRMTSLDVKANLAAFALYNLVLLAAGTDYVSVYTTLYTDPPTTIAEYLCQRYLISSCSF